MYSILDIHLENVFRIQIEVGSSGVYLAIVGMIFLALIMFRCVRNINRLVRSLDTEPTKEGRKEILHEVNKNTAIMFIGIALWFIFS